MAAQRSTADQGVAASGQPEQTLATRVQAAVDAGQPQVALALCRARLLAAPDDVEAHRHLGTVHAALGQRPEAEARAARATALAPTDARAWADRGRVHALFGALPEAIAAFERAVGLDASDADAWHNLGTALARKDRPQEAFSALKRALQLDPSRSDSYLQIAALLLRAHQFVEAKECVERALAFDCRGTAGGIAGRLLMDAGLLEEALGCFRRAVATGNANGDEWFDLGRVQEDLGVRTLAIEAYVTALALEPRHVLALGAYLTLAAHDAAPSVTARAEALLAATETADSARAIIGYGLARHHDRRGAHASAAKAGRCANLARRRTAGTLDRRALKARIDNSVASYKAEFFASGLKSGIKTDQPVFIVGLPRSGTTLVEQILAAHPQMHGAGELPDLARIAAHVADDAGATETLPAAQRDQRKRLAAAHAYLAALRRGAPNGAVRISDKSPLNFFHLGLAAALFPNARVVHCTRDLRDTALSIWLENFQPDQQWATEFEDLAYFAAQYRRLMAHWREVLPLSILEVAYEDTVTDLEAQARQLTAFMDVPWDSRCLDFHRSGRAVSTPSRWQVRQPIYTRSVGRWRHYRAYLPELERAIKGEHEEVWGGHAARARSGA